MRPEAARSAYDPVHEGIAPAGVIRPASQPGPRPILVPGAIPVRLPARPAAMATSSPRVAARWQKGASPLKLPAPGVPRARFGPPADVALLAKRHHTLEQRS